MADKAGSRSLEETQAELLKQRAEVLESLGLAELNERFENVTEAAKAARRRASIVATNKRKSRGQDQPTRRSLRVQRIAPDGTGLPALAVIVSNPPLDENRPRPEGDVLYSDTLAGRQLKEDAAGIMGVLRSATASLVDTFAGKTGSASASTVTSSPSRRSQRSSTTAVARSAGDKEPHGVSAYEHFDPELGVWPLVRGASSNGKKGAANPGAMGRPIEDLAKVAIPSARYVMKVVPDRIYSVAIHPANDKLIGICGSKWGRIGIWCPDAEVLPRNADEPTSPKAGYTRKDSFGADETLARRLATDETIDGEVDDAEEEEEEFTVDAHTVAVFMPHVRPVSQVFVPRGAPHLILSSSYDGSARVLDINTGISSELCAEEYDVSGLDCNALSADAGGGVLHMSVYAGTRYGELMHLDTRETPSKVYAFLAHQKKITNVSSMAGSPYILTSSADATVAVWDIRSIKGTAPKSVAVLKGKNTFTTAYFSAHGHRVVATGMDDTVRVWDVSSAAGVSDPPSCVIKHNNQTGRWVTPFRAVFDPANDDTIVLGSMKRELQFYRASTGSCVASLTSDYLTAIPPLNAVHPNPHVHAIISGTASGRMYLWTA